MAEDALTVKIREWLERSGYLLEMEVAQAFRDAEFVVYQGQYYEDSQATREIDVIADEVRSTSAGLLHIIFYVECKLSRDKPWIIFLGSRRSHYASKEVLVQGPSNPTGEALGRLIAAGPGVDILPIYQDLSQPGYGMVQGLRKADGFDASYVATMQVCKAARVFIKGARRNEAAIGIPVVVVDGPLYKARRVVDAVTLEQAGQGEVLVQDPAVGRGTVVIIVAKNSLGDFVARARSTADRIVRWCSENSPAVNEAFQYTDLQDAICEMRRELGDEEASAILEDLRKQFGNLTAMHVCQRIFKELQAPRRKKKHTQSRR